MAKLTRRAAFIQAVGIQESGGNYSDVNHSSGALGKYQVMPSNVASWTQRALGHSLTPEQFLQSPSAQDAVANTILGGYYDKWGPRGAAAAWYAGPGNHGLYDSTAPQNGGPSIASYVDSVLGHMRDVLGGKATVTTSTNPGATAASANTAANTSGHNPNDWIGTLNGVLNPHVGGFSLNPFADAKNVGATIELVAARAIIGLVGLTLLGAGLLVAFGDDIFGGLARQAPGAAATADAVNSTYGKEYDREHARQRARRDARRDLASEDESTGRHAEGAGRHRKEADSVVA